MWPFKKSKEIIDFTDMQKRGLLKESAQVQPENNGQVSSGDYKDLTSSSAGGSVTDLFGAIASSSGDANSTISSSSSGLRDSSGAFKNKVEDIEFKLDNLRKKLDNFLNRLELVEKKAGVWGA